LQHKQERKEMNTWGFGGEDFKGREDSGVDGGLY
jgi:hypothetical protein